MNEQPILTTAEETPASVPLPPSPPESSPEPETELPVNPPEPEISPSEDSAIPSLRRVIPLLLGGVGILFFSVTVVCLLLKSGITADGVTRSLLASLFGSGRILPVTAAESLPGEPVTPMVPDSAPLTESSLSAPSVLPAETPHISEPVSLTLSNETPYQPDMAEILLRPRAVPTLAELRAQYGEEAPLVLILHTHGTEAYADTAENDYRSDDPAKNIIAIGALIADRLNDAGIPALHCTTAFDTPDFSMAYYNAAMEIRSALEEYPSLAYIIDVHRDSILFPDGSYYATLGRGESGSAGQILFVVGTDHGGSGHTGWRDNLALAARIHQSIAGDYPTMMRDIHLRSASFNEQYTAGSMLVEVGSCACTMEQAEAGAEIFADALIREIVGE